MISPGIELEKLCAEACSDVVLAAPFIKASVLARLLANIPATVTIKCITRWRPEEILVGVSDLEVWFVMKNRPNSKLWLRPDLHAKFYRADERCLVGSANLTAAALGWSYQSNLELLVPMPASEPVLRKFEAELIAGCVQVDESLFEQMSVAVRLLAENYPNLPPFIIATPNIPSKEHSPPYLVPVDAWLPTLRNPEELYLAYSGRQERLTTAARKAALEDLRSLPVVPNLPRAAFKAYVGTFLLQKPIVQKVDLFVETPQRFGAVRDLLSSLPCASVPSFNPDRAWQTLMRWLRYFLPNRYMLSVPNYSEVFCRIKSSSSDLRVHD